MNIFQKIGRWLTGVVESLNQLFDKAQGAIEKVFNALTTEAQEITIEASKIIDVINSNLDLAPEALVEIIEIQFPQFSKDKIKELLAQASDEVDKVENLSKLPLEELLQKLQEYLKERPNNNSWAKASSGLAKLLALLIAKERGVVLVWAIIETVMTWVYENKVKPQR